MSTRPNVLFIMTDHTNAAALAPGSPCLTPSLDRLAAEGRRFAHCYTTNAICSPARASLMTGTYPSTHGMWDCTHTQRQAWVNVASHLVHWASRFEDAGYQTGYFGKWHVEQTKKLDDFGWQESSQAGTRKLAKLPEGQVVVPKPGYNDYLLAAVGDDSEGHPAHPAFEHGIDFLRRAVQEDAPFCCFVSTTEPHDPYVPPKAFLNLYDVDSIPLSPTLKDELGGKPEVLRRMQAVWQDLTDADWRRMAASYWAVITYLDHEVGRIMDVLRESGADENTIVVFTSDHGDMLGGHGLVAKGVGTAYEEVYNIPLIIRAPGLTAGTEDVGTRTSLVDVGPTLLDLAGLASLPEANGRSLRPVLADEHDGADWLDAYAEFFGQRFVYTQRLVWHDQWKYVFSPGGIDELYNLADDPQETTNLADDPAHRQTLEDMCRRMWRKMKTIGDDSLSNTHYATLRTAPVGPNSAEE